MELGIGLILYSLILILINIMDKHITIYFAFFYYLILIVLFILKNYYGLKELKKLLKNKLKATMLIFFTIIITLGFYLLGEFIVQLVKINTFGGGIYKTNTIFSAIIFGITTMFMPSFAEEGLFRKAFYNKFCKNRPMLILGIIISCTLFGFEHSFKVGIALPMALFGLGLYLSFLYTKNIWVPIIAHLLINVITNGISFIATMLVLLQKMR